MRILVLQIKRIGDAVLTAPALAALRRSLPQAEIHLVLHGPSGGLGPAFPGLASATGWRPRALNSSVWGRVLPGKWDAVLDFTGTDRSFLLSAASRAGVRLAYASHAAKKGWRARVPTALVDASVRDLTTVDFHLAMAQAGVEQVGGTWCEPGEPPFLDVPEEMVPEGLPDRYAVVHPGTARDEKYWLEDRWAEVVRHLKNAHRMEVVLTGSGDARETEHLEPLRQTVGEDLLDLAGQLELVETAAVIARAAMVVSVDSAAMHLAAQFGVPQVALFGPTNPYHWVPRHERARVLLAGAGEVKPEAMTPRHAKADMARITADEVIRVIDGVL